MIKECNVISRNDLIMVVTYGDTKVQLTSDHKNTDTVFVKYEREKYSISDKEAYDLEISKEKTKTQKKRIKEVVEHENSEL